MAKQENTSSGIGAQAAASISMLLPILQFFYQWLPDNLSGIFLGRDIFFFVSVLTLVLSLLVIFWYRSAPFFRILPFWEKSAKNNYLQFLRNTDIRIHSPEDIKKIKIVIPPPFEITAPILASWSIPAIFIFGLLFVWLGLSYQSAPSTILKIFQASTYVLTIVSCAFSATHYYLSLEGQKEWNWSNQTKIQRAIQLAIENNGIPEIPRINYLSSGEPQPQSFPPNFFVLVGLNTKKYLITTDQRAEVLHSVQPFKE